MKKEKRNSNFELLRIIAMIMIVSLHTLGHGGGLTNTTVNSMNFVFNHILESLSIVAVNVFILISGYFGIRSYSCIKNKIIILYKQMIFYSISIGLLFIIFNKSLSIANIVQMLFPISTQLWWFMSLNIILLILSPYINKIIFNLTGEEFKKLLKILVLIFVVWPSILGIFEPIDISGGYSLYQFIFMYIVGAYIRINYENKRFSCRNSFLIYLSVSLVLATMNIVFSNFLGYNFGIYAYNFILIFISSISLFLCFKDLRLKYNQTINNIAKLTLGVYLIHDHPLVRNWIYKFLHLSNSFNATYYILSVITIIIAIFIGCSSIEFIRKKIFFYFEETVRKIIEMFNVSSS